VVVEANFDLLEYDVYVRFNNQKLVTILFFIGDGILFLHLRERYHIPDRAIAVQHCTVIFKRPNLVHLFSPCVAVDLESLVRGADVR
jgi:hypothetical protein